MIRFSVSDKLGTLFGNYRIFCYFDGESVYIQTCCVRGSTFTLNV